jgi:hypothetical protein
MEQKPDTTTKVITITIGIFAIIFLIAKVAEIRNERQTAYLPVTAGDSLIVDTTANSYDTTTSITQEVAQSRWSYDQTTDKMTNKVVKFASIDANDLLYFDFPYDGGVKATFTIRKKGKATDIYLSISKGQFMDTSSGGTVSIKFDDEAKHSYSFVGSADYSSDIIFISNEAKLLAKLRKAQKMLIAATFYQEGTHVMTFETAGLNF